MRRHGESRPRPRSVSEAGGTRPRPGIRHPPAGALLIASIPLFVMGCMQSQTTGVNPLIRTQPQPAPMPVTQVPVYNPQAGDPPPPPDEPNIIGIRKIISQEPWLSFNREGLRQAEGFKATVYLESGKTGRGAFGDGTIRVSMYVVDRGADGETLQLAARWELDPEQSIPWRARRPTQLGWGYGLRLPWGEANVNGREIELVFQYLRRDGVVLSSEPMRLRVPPRGVRIIARQDGSPADPPPPKSSVPAAE